MCDAKINDCGINAVCQAQNHQRICSCPADTKGNPKESCIKIECSDNYDCDSRKSCLENHCVDLCSFSNACGQNALCNVVNHVRNCACMPGFTGNPILGCTQAQFCNSDNQCPTSTKCSYGQCSTICSSSRDCLSDQLCILSQNVCQQTCKTNSTCQHDQFCQNNICIQEPKCQSDDECSVNEHCMKETTTGRSECKPVCSSRFLCGRNSECLARDHNAVCECKSGFYLDGKTCKKIECNSDENCRDDQKCEDYRCKIVCLMENQKCGRNAVCVGENHQPCKKT